MLTETWYSDESEVLRLSLYHTYFLNRTAKRGGGVAILATRGTVCELLSDFSTVTDDYEVLSLRVNKNIVSVVYRPPDGNILNFFKISGRTFLVYKNK